MQNVKKKKLILYLRPISEFQNVWDRCIVSIILTLQIPFRGKCIIISVISVLLAQNVARNLLLNFFRSEIVNILKHQGLSTINI